MSTEYPELFEKIDELDKLMDIQTGLFEKMNDRVDGMREVMLQLVADVEAMRRSRTKRKGSSTPSVPGGIA